MRLRETISLLLLLLILNSFEFSIQEGQNPRSKKKPASTTSTTGHSTQIKFSTELNQKKIKAEIVKLQEEAEKLKAEMLKLNEETKKLKSFNQNIREWATAIGSIIGGIIILFVGFLLKRTFYRTQKDKMEQDKRLAQEKHVLEQSKMRQDREFAREQHLLDVFRELGSTEPRIRIGAASVLIQRLKKLHDENNPTDHDITYEHERHTIASVLLAETKQEEEKEIQKYIADGLVKSLGAIVPDEKKGPDTMESPLKMYDLDFQNAKLCNAWWKRIDAREVDFFGAGLVEASLREGFLQKAVFYNADLSKAILVKANLESANLQKATLKKTNFSGANLKKADLRNVDLSNSIIDGADFREAKFNNRTKLKKEQLNQAIFNDEISQQVTFVD